MAEEDEHSANLYCVIVGNTSKARKGVSWSRVRSPFGMVHGDWVRDCVTSGLSSGEGLIWKVRDRIEKEEPIKEKGRVVGSRVVVVDQGVEDKRLLFCEGEFAKALRVLGRDGNTLSSEVRMAWDGGDLSIRTKNNAAEATGAHISIITHITRDELLRYLDRTEAGNRFGNRFLWVCAKRSKSLPERGPALDYAPLVGRLREVIDYTRAVREMTRDAEARALWHEVCGEFSDGKPGSLGAATARAEAQVMRVACIYALLDKSAVVRREHLEAALEIWRYCDDSARRWGIR